jgi:hypothetical protein
MGHAGSCNTDRVSGYHLAQAALRVKGSIDSANRQKHFDLKQSGIRSAPRRPAGSSHCSQANEKIDSRAVICPCNPRRVSYKQVSHGRGDNKLKQM